jgi:hypothetical protein
MKRFLIALLVAGVLALVVLVGGTAQNRGCIPWHTAVTTVGSLLSEGNRGRAHCH